MLTLYFNPSSFFRISKCGVLVPDHAQVFVDSILLYWVLACFDLHIPRRCFDLSMDIGDAAHLFSLVFDDHNSKLLFIGGSDTEASLFAELISRRFKLGDRILAESGFAEDLLEKTDFLVRKYEPTHLIFGLGAPLQERLAIYFDQKYPALDIRTCGGFITQTAINQGDFYPAWIQKIGARWLYRFFKQPKVISRVIFEYPMGIFLFVKAEMAKNRHLANHS